MRVTRDRRVEIRWLGDESTEEALLRSIGLVMGMNAVAPGHCERWMSVPARQSAAALAALARAGARILRPQATAR